MDFFDPSLAVYGPYVKPFRRGLLGLYFIKIYYR